MTEKKESKKNSCLLQVIAIPIGGIIFWYLMKYIILWVPNLANFLEYIQTPLKESGTWQSIGLVTAIITAVGLYQIKKRIIIIFGLIEIFGGGWAIWATFSQNFENSVLYALAIAGGIFLMVNGFENFKKYKMQSRNSNKTE